MNQPSNNDQVKNLIQIRKSLARNKNGSLSQNQAFLDFLKLQTDITAEIEKTWDTVRDTMLKYDVTKIDGDWGSITMAERKTFSGAASRRFMKRVLDTDKVRSYYALYKRLPEGVKLSTTKYLSKKIKLA